MNTKNPGLTSNVVRTAFVVAAVALSSSVVRAQGVDFRQAANNDPVLGDINWINSILQSSNSVYYEGVSVPQRLIFVNIPATTGNVHTLTFNHQATKGGVHAYDYLTSWQQAVDSANAIAPGQDILIDLFTDACGPAIGPQASTAICNALRGGANVMMVDAPDIMGSVLGDSIDASIAAYEVAFGNRQIKIYGNAPISSASMTFNGHAAGLEAPDVDANYTLTWTSASTQILIEMAGHLSVGPDNGGGVGIGYGPGLGASAISGGPYHLRVVQLDGASLGQQDNQIKGADIILPFCVPGACDDGVVCTIDECDEITDTCTNTASSGECDDGLFCTGTATCDPELGCQPDGPPNCDDGNPCTIDSCNEDTDQCDNIPDDSFCSDGDFCNGDETCDVIAGCVPGTPPNCNDGVNCTIDSCDEVNDTCVNTPDDAVCSDGAYCNGDETCDPLNGCEAGTPPNCSDGVGCTDDTCDEVNDICVNTPIDGNCDDGQFCNGVETCDPVLGCQAGTAPNCDDGNPCTVDSCNEMTDSCVNTPMNSLCSDGLYCNGAEVCDPIAGCEAGTPPNCDDAVGCTEDTCDEANDTCVNTPVDGNCDDGAFCNGVEFCDPVNDCQPGTPPNCGDGIACTIDVCDELNDTCVSTPDDSLCSNGLFCDGDEVCDPLLGCVPGTPPNCDDGVDCTDDSCDEVDDECDNVPNDNNCDDGQFCNGMETCDPVNGCEPGTNPCTGDLICDEVNDECVNCLDDTDCDDGLYCNGMETCDPSGVCLPGTPPVCDDGVGCTVDSCDEATDSCVATPNNASCNDGLFCNGVEFCDPLNDCQAGTPPVCNDGVICTFNSCDEDTDSCVFTPDNSACNDGQYCNGVEFCDPNNDCQAGTPPVCDDGVVCTVDTCNENTDSCDFTPNNAVCNDGAFCNGVETCDPIDDCQAGTPVDCDDGVSCTVDSCNEDTDSCNNLADDAICNDGAFCNGVETCDPLNDCQAGAPPNCNDGVNCTVDSCDEDTDSCVNAPSDAVCDDGAFCNGLETCDPQNGCEAGTPVMCGDGVGCTDDRCDEDTDMCVNDPNDANCDDGAFCNGAETCDPLQGCQAGTAPNCNDGISCTSDFCDDDRDTCVNDPSDAACDDGAFCNGVETCDPENDCQAGTPVDCDDAVGCTVDSCDESKDTCVNMPDDASCTDGAFCNGVEICDPEGDCQAGTPVDCGDGVDCTDDACDEDRDECVSTPNDANCDDGAFCNGVEICDPEGDCLAGTAPDCDDAIDCTIDGCDEDSDSCVSTPSDAFCSDGDPCTIDTCTGIGCNYQFICGACCVDDVCRNKLTLEDCLVQGGAFNGNGSACQGDNDGDGRDDACPFEVIPTVSQWGLATLTLLLLIAAKVAFRVRPETV